MSVSESPLLEVEGLTVDFDPGKPSVHRALDGVSLSIGEGEVLALVGESGSGKTVLSHAILGLLPPNGRVVSGHVRWKGRELQGLTEKQLLPIRGKEIAMIFQDASSAFNPVFSIRAQFRWVLKLHRHLVGKEADSETMRLLEAVQLEDTTRIMNSLPTKLSGGMAQRAMVGLAIACSPKLIVADEPTSALDRIVQSEIVELLASIHRQMGTSFLVVTHDLGMARRLATKVAVIKNGAILEEGTTRQIFEKPQHDYTKRLIAAADLTPIAA